ncbi:hypothetical protein [Candidatus Chloroploca sp. Khr17]|uniref:hypothetical protein n=1 Tax=Candidatus Chloroploca sp. Khr17 TaxID=2496869 RepID=UPI00101B8098|nr:hypothetical protein [Candidatus Chloroploca sp. Khr17]
MSLFIFGSIVAIVSVITGIYLGGRMAEREEQKSKELPVAAPTPVSEATSDAPAEKRRFWFGASNQSEQALQFQKWASANLPNAELRTWIDGLSKEQVSALADQLAHFCTNLGFNLDWLTNQRLSGNPSLEKAAIAIVNHYCSACFQATTIQGDFEFFKQALELLDQPFSREHKLITQKIYADLVRREAAPALSPDLMVANEQARQEQIGVMLREAATNNWTIFMAVFEEASRADGATKKPSWGSSLRNTFRRREPTSHAAPAASAEPQVVASSNETA